MSDAAAREVRMPHDHTPDYPAPFYVRLPDGSLKATGEKAPRQQTGWRPIETAPRDGTNLLVWWPVQFHAPLVAHWSDGKYVMGIGWKVSGWGDCLKTSPTHWMPLPEPPE